MFAHLPLRGQLFFQIIGLPGSSGGLFGTVLLQDVLHVCHSW